MKSERVLLSGCGDLGQRVAQRLLARGTEVWALRRHPPAEDRSGIRWLAGDLAVPDGLPDLPPGITALVHLPAPDRRDREAYRAVFREGLPRVLQGLDPNALRRVLLVSSSAVYGDAGGAWVDESTPPDPPGFNGEVLLQTERWLQARAVESAVLRLAGLYGPGRTGLIDRLRAGTARVPRTPVHWANRIHVDDAAAALVHLLDLPAVQPIYVGCDDTPLPLAELYDHLCTLLGLPEMPNGPPPAGVGSKRLSNARLRASGFVPRWPDARDGYAALLQAGD